MTTDSSNTAITQHVATLLDDLITWRTIGSKQLGLKIFEFYIKIEFVNHVFQIHEKRRIFNLMVVLGWQLIVHSIEFYSGMINK